MVTGWFPDGFRMVTYPLGGIYLVNFGIFESSFFNWCVSQIASYLFKGYWIVSGWFPHIWQIKMLLILFPWIINYLCALLLTYFFILHDTNLLLPCDIMENSQRGGFQKKFESLTQFLLCWVKKLENVKPLKNHNWTNVWLLIRRKTKNTSSIRNPTCCFTILLGGSIPSC